MHTIRLIHWNEKEAQEKSSILKKRGFKVIHSIIRGQQDMRELRKNPADAFVIDLTRLPSQGRDLGMFVRQSKSTRYVPLIFVEGEKEKVDRIKKLIPDAHYTSWPEIHRTIQKALTNPIENPVAPKSLFDTYMGIPLLKKLGIKENTILGIINPPKEFKKTLGRLPDGVRIQSKLKKERDLTLWFVKSEKELQENIQKVSKYSKNEAVWILWPKKGSESLQTYHKTL